MNFTDFLPLPAFYRSDGEHREYFQDVRKGEHTPRFNIFETDDGWAVEVTVRTAGAVESVKACFLLPQDMQAAMVEAYDEAEELLVWRSGLGLQVTFTNGDN